MKHLRKIAAIIITSAILSGALFALPSSASITSFRPTLKGAFLYGIPEKTTFDKLSVVLANISLEVKDLAGKTIEDKDKSTALIGTGFTVIINGSSYTAVILGDVDGDGVIDSIDYQLVKRHYLGISKITDDAKLLAACNEKLDGKIKAVTYLMIKRHVIGNYNMNMDYTVSSGDESGWTGGWH